MKILENVLNFWISATTPPHGDLAQLSKNEREQHRKHRVLSISMLLATTLSFPLLVLYGFRPFNQTEIALILYEFSMFACIYQNRIGNLFTAVNIYIGSYIVLTAWGLWFAPESEILWSWTELIITPIISGLFLPWWSSVLFGLLSVVVADIELIHFQMARSEASFVPPSEYAVLYTYTFVILMALATLGALYAYNLEKAIEGADRANEIERAHAALEKAHSDLAAAYRRADHLAQRDALTGLLNHRTFNTKLDELLKTTISNFGNVVVLFCDIDYFKRINDNFGHQAGDAALQAISEQLQLYFGPDIPIGRYGGEEFVAAFTLKNRGFSHADDDYQFFAHESATLADRLRQTIAQLDISFEDCHSSDDKPDIFNITVSIGIAIYPFHGRTLEELISEADSAMYRAKHQGRNLVCIASHSFEKEAA